VIDDGVANPELRHLDLLAGAASGCLREIIMKL
jgi:hypothetical protein